MSRFPLHFFYAVCAGAACALSIASATPTSAAPPPAPSTGSSTAASVASSQGLDRLLADGQHALDTKDVKMAADIFAQGLDKADAAGDKARSASFLTGLGSVSRQAKQFDEALEYYSKALALRESLGDKTAIAHSLFNMGNVYKQLSQYDKAADSYTRAAALQEAIGSKADAASSLIGLGNLYFGIGQFSKALDTFSRVLALQQGVADESAIAGTLEHIGNAYTVLGDVTKALDYYSRSLELRKKSNNQADIAYSLEDLGNAYSELGDFDKGSDLMNQALTIQEALHDQRGVAATLTNLGANFMTLGQASKAMDCFRRALDFRNSTGDTENIADLLNNIAAVYYSTGDFDKATDYFGRALEVYQHLNHEKYIAICLDNLGSCYGQLGQRNEALALELQSLKIAQKLGDSEQEATDTLNIGNEYGLLGRTDEAITYSTRALGMFQKRGNQFLIEAALSRLGGLFYLAGQLDKAFDFTSQALTLAQKLGNEQEEAAALDNIGIIHLDRNETDAALKSCQQALALRERLGNKKDLGASYANLGNVYFAEGRLDEARSAYEKALSNDEALNEQVSDSSDLGALQEASQGTLYARYARLLVQLHRPSEALIMAERGRVQGLQRQIAQGHVDFSHLLSADDAAKLQSATEDMTKAGHLLRVVMDRGEPSNVAEKKAYAARLADVQKRNDAAERGYKFIQDALPLRYPALRQARQPQVTSWEQMQSLTEKNPDTLYLEWAVAERDRTQLFALSKKDGLKTFSLPIGGVKLTEAAQAWHKAVSQRDLTEPPKARTLYKALFGALESAHLLAPKRYMRLVIVADGPLLNIPFAALLDGQGQRLVNRYAVSSSLSLGSLTWPSNPNKPSATMLCAADPAGAKAEAFGGTSKPIQSASVRSGFGPLQYARTEAKQVTGLFPGAVGLAGPAAREAIVKRDIGKFALLHFATHGVLDEQDGMRSWLLLAPEPEGSTEDGRLEAREIVGLPLSAVMATLSACQTAEGKQSGGEGLLGLAWAFRAAGCPSVVGSQWEVDDQATGQLMNAFYRRLKAGSRKDDALRTAMLIVQRNPKHSQPFWWAGFQVIGDTKPLPAWLIGNSK